jgi:hypothetical protein
MDKASRDAAYSERAAISDALGFHIAVNRYPITSAASKAWIIAHLR